MKKIIILIILIVITTLWFFKRDVILTLMPIAINLMNPIAENQDTNWQIGEVQDKSNKPNIILILADDMGFNDVSFYNGGAADGSLKTPNIDSLAKKGVQFESAFVQSPVCGPSRASYYTGRTVFSHGSTWNQVPLPIGELTIGDYLRQ